MCFLSLLAIVSRHCPVFFSQRPWVSSPTASKNGENIPDGISPVTEVRSQCVVSDSCAKDVFVPKLGSNDPPKTLRGLVYSTERGAYEPCRVLLKGTPRGRLACG